jgi:hypothetical protein
MPLRAETEWTLTACALIAHADGVLAGEECERLLGMIDEHMSGDEYSTWLERIGDREALERHLEALARPGVGLHRELLEQAWDMAMVDGDRCDAEIRVLHDLAARLGVAREQIDFWREAWAGAARTFADVAARAAEVMLAGPGGTIEHKSDRAAFDAFVDQLPTTHEHRDQLRNNPPDRTEMVDVGRQLGALARRKRDMVLALLAGLVPASTDPEGTADRLRALGEAAGIPSARASEIAEQARGRARP